MAVHGLIVRALGGGVATGSIGLLITRGLLAGVANLIHRIANIHIIHHRQKRR